MADTLLGSQSSLSSRRMDLKYHAQIGNILTAFAIDAVQMSEVLDIIFTVRCFLPRMHSSIILNIRKHVVEPYGEKRTIVFCGQSEYCFDNIWCHLLYRHSCHRS